MSDVLGDTLIKKWQNWMDITNAWLSQPDTLLIMKGKTFKFKLRY